MAGADAQVKLLHKRHCERTVVAPHASSSSVGGHKRQCERTVGAPHASSSVRGGACRFSAWLPSRGIELASAVDP